MCMYVYVYIYIYSNHNNNDNSVVIISYWNIYVDMYMYIYMNNNNSNNNDNNNNSPELRRLVHDDVAVPDDVLTSAADTCDVHMATSLRPICLLSLSLLWSLDSNFREIPYGPGNSIPKFKIMLESNPLKSIMLVRRLAEWQPVWPCWRAVLPRVNDARTAHRHGRRDSCMRSHMLLPREIVEDCSFVLY